VDDDKDARRLAIFAGIATAIGATAWILAMAAALDAYLL